MHVEELHCDLAIGFPEGPVVVRHVARRTKQLAPLFLFIVLSWIQQICLLCFTRRGCAAAEVLPAGQ